MAPADDGASSPAPADTTATCECGNSLTPGEQQCEWCQTLEHAKDSQTVPHVWQTSRITNTTTCSVCKLLPLDAIDGYSDCRGPR